MFFINPFAGQIGRQTWWLSQLAIWVMVIFAMFLTVIFISDPNASAGNRNPGESLSLLGITIAAVYMNFATCLNRLRDSGRHGIWYLSFLLPLVGTGLMLYFCGIEEGDGNDPYAPEELPKFSQQQYQPSNGIQSGFGQRR